MTQILEKTCTLCGVDLNGQKRVKNASGDYYCPPCWEAHNSIVGESSAVVNPSKSPQAAVARPATASAPTNPPTVRVTRSEFEPTVAQAVVQGAKEGVAIGLFRVFRKVLVFLQVIVVVGLTKKFFPDANNGIVGIVILTSVTAGVLEVELIARAIKSKDVWIDKEILTSRVGIFVIIGFGLAYALCIFLAIIGG